MMQMGDLCANTVPSSSLSIESMAKGWGFPTKCIPLRPLSLKVEDFKEAPKSRSGITDAETFRL